MKRSIVVAERELILEQTDRNRQKLRKRVVVQLGKPYWITRGQEAACQVCIRGLYEDLAPIRGSDPYQALEMAILFVDMLIGSTPRKRRRFLWPHGERYESLAAILKASNLYKAPEGRRRLSRK
jgi:hypothetical protein